MPSPKPFRAMKTEQEMMAEIVAKVGPTEGRQLVMSAYNAEILANRLGRLEDQRTSIKAAKGKVNMLKLAVERVHHVVMLMP